jgi:thiamine-monophosphate kinase
MDLIATGAGKTSANAMFDAEKQLEFVLAGGDDYELAFTAPAAQRDAVQAAARASQTTVTRIGQIEAAAGLRLVDGQGRPVTRRFASFDHFA